MQSHAQSRRGSQVPNIGFRHSITNKRDIGYCKFEPKGLECIRRLSEEQFPLLKLPPPETTTEPVGTPA